MSTGNSSAPQIVSVPANADLSSNQFLLHTINTSGNLALATTRGERVAGVLLDDPAAAGRPGQLCYGGICRVKAGGTFEEGKPLTTDASGQAIEATELGDVVFGTSIEAGVSGAGVKCIIGVAGGYISAPSTILVEDLSGYLVTDVPMQRAVAGTIGTGTAGDLNILQLMSGTKLGLWVIGTQTIVNPVGVAGGVSIGYDQTDNDGIEVWSSAYPASGAPMVVGDAAYQFTCAVNFALANGTDDLFIGLRKQEAAYQAATTDYNTYFGLGCDTAASPMLLKVREELNGAAGASTSTTDTQADGVTLWVKVLVSAAGVATVQHGDTKAGLAAPTATSAFSFDVGDVLVPTLRFLQANAAQTGVVKLIHWECGPQ